MAIDPERTQDVLDAYLSGTLPLTQAAERIAAMLEPQERLGFTIDVPLASAATIETKRLAELRWAVVRSRERPQSPRQA